MTMFIITLLISIAVGINSSLNKKQEALMYRATNKGSRTIELEEWDKWSNILLKEYNALTGLAIPYPEIKFTSDDFGRAYYIAFSDPYDLHMDNKWKDMKAIETLRTRHALPSDDELYALDECLYNKKILYRPPRYTCLAYIIEKCVLQSVIEHGYKNGGIDWDGQEAIRAKWKEIEFKNEWLKNESVDSDSS